MLLVGKGMALFSPSINCLWFAFQTLLFLVFDVRQIVPRLKDMCDERKLDTMKYIENYTTFTYTKH